MLCNPDRVETGPYSVPGPPHARVETGPYSVPGPPHVAAHACRYILDSKHAEHSFAEWRPISVGYVIHDVMTTGNLTMAALYYDSLKAGNYTLAPWLDPRVGPSPAFAFLRISYQDYHMVLPTFAGLVNVSSLPAAEIDWPSNMRDCHVSSDYSTIVNAYVARANAQMARVAGWLGKRDEAASFTAAAASIRAALNSRSWDPLHSRFCDGVCTPARPAGERLGLCGARS